MQSRVYQYQVQFSQSVSSTVQSEYQVQCSQSIRYSVVRVSGTVCPSIRYCVVRVYKVQCSVVRVYPVQRTVQ